MSGRSSPRSSSALARIAATLVALCVATSTAACESKRGGGGPGSGTGGADGVGGARKGEPLLVGAASDLTPAFEELGPAFERATGKHVTFAFASTGVLAKQLAEGAPYDVFAAANMSYVDDVVRAQACDGASKQIYARGRLAMWSKDKALLPAKLEGLRDPKLVKIALANPEHAPYGIAAQQAMTRAGVWDDVKPRAVYGQNVQQTMMFAQSGNAEVALVALSLAMTSGGSYVVIDENLHAPLEQALVICKGGPAGGKPNEARAFVDFVASEPGHAIVRKHGFLLPGEAVPAPPK
jgi:molybdate transport system substrate-binding protein